MATALQVVNAAAEELYVKTAEVALESEDYQIILDRLNDMCFEWKDDGLLPSFTAVSNQTDVLNVERNAVLAIKLNLAILCAPVFQRTVSQALASNALKALTRLENSVVFIGPVAYPDSLPTGSGNDCGHTYHNDRFYPENKTERF